MVRLWFGRILDADPMPYPPVFAPFSWQKIMPVGVGFKGLPHAAPYTRGSVRNPPLREPPLFQALEEGGSGHESSVPLKAARQIHPPQQILEARVVAN
jgi:hypothetical protein